MSYSILKLLNDVVCFHLFTNIICHFTMISMNISQRTRTCNKRTNNGFTEKISIKMGFTATMGIKLNHRRHFLHINNEQQEIILVWLTSKSHENSKRWTEKKQQKRWANEKREKMMKIGIFLFSCSIIPIFSITYLIRIAKVWELSAFLSLDSRFPYQRPSTYINFPNTQRLVELYFFLIIEE